MRIYGQGRIDRYAPNVKEKNTVMTTATEQTDISEESVVETEAEEAKLIGVVSNCTKLNVRKKADSKALVLATIPVSSGVMIDLNKSTDEFYKVCTAAGIEGFCMKKYITVPR